MSSQQFVWPKQEPPEPPRHDGFPSADLFGEAPENCEGCWNSEIIALAYGWEKACIRWVPYLDAWLCSKCLHNYSAWIEARPRYESEEMWNKFTPDGIVNLRIYRQTGRHPWNRSGTSESSPGQSS